ncbi:hypothetical protein Fmac_000942 [Flemingia macrophylla]|uniref:CAND6/7 N-terminal domain-containing protein n=1 Tax=Flemingia macrophylla TaxID=520843 RepID=A0ABD1NFP1_9FABA
MAAYTSPFRCILHSRHTLRLFTFRVLSLPPSSSFNRTYPVTTSNEYNLFFANCNPDTIVSISPNTSSSSPTLSTFSPSSPSNTASTLPALLALPTTSSSSSLALPASFFSSRHASFATDANHAHSLRLSIHSRIASPDRVAAAAIHRDLNRTGSCSFPSIEPKEELLLPDAAARKARYVDLGFEGDDKYNIDGSHNFEDVSEKIGFMEHFAILIKLYEI